MRGFTQSFVSVVTVTVALAGCTSSPRVTIHNDSDRTITGLVQIPGRGGLLAPPPCTRQEFVVQPYSAASYARSNGWPVSMWSYVEVAWLSTDGRWVAVRIDPKDAREVAIRMTADASTLEVAMTGASHEVIEHRTFADQEALFEVLGEPWGR